MTNAFAVCLIALLCCTNLSFARQAPKECAKGPSVWCESLKRAADCGAVGHCTSTVWENKDPNAQATRTELTDAVYKKFEHLFAQLKDVRELINEDYLATRISSECHDVKYSSVAKMCKEKTAELTPYIFHVLQSNTSAQTLCQIIGICDNEEVNSAIAVEAKKVTPKKNNGRLLGASQCTWGPSYWCSNFSTGRECKATHHCVTRVWSKMTFPEDNDGICKICTDMVQQARDQLQSNETQEELKEVFEGSCQLIPIKVVAKECMKLADDFVPELVETLASQMNPQAVCSVAGLCNNAKIDALLERFNTKMKLRAECNNCQSTVGVLRKKFDATSYDDFLVGLLQVCRRMDSLSDSCSMLVFQYYENILEAVKKDLTPQSLCHVSGQCAYKFHSHDEFTFPNAFTDYKENDDVPCEFCEQLVKHLRDVLVANTTEMEFSKVLKGLCKQTGKFKDECLHLADEYYPLIYKFLTEDLKGDVICSMIGMCGNATSEPVAPLLPMELAVKAVTMTPKFAAGEEKLSRVPVSPKQTNVRVLEDTEPLPPLPLERMFVSAPPQPQGKAACSFCQYFLHYVQVEISDSRNEDQIMSIVDKACDKLPNSVNEECKQFVTQYGPSVIALLVQQIDPASICPALGLCPQTQEIHRVEVQTVGASNCPLCLFAVEEVIAVIKNNRSEETIRQALDNLCSHLSDKMRTQCVDFVDKYSNQLVEMLDASLDPQEICVFLKLCKDQVHDPLNITRSSIDKYHDKPQLRGDRNNFRRKPLLPTKMLVKDADIETNEIPDNTVNGRHVRPPVSDKSVCVICEFVLKEIDDQIKDKKNEDEIKKIVHGVCTHMPKSVRSQCDQFVEKYADLVISLLAQELDPDEVCEELKLCSSSGHLADIQTVKEGILDCAVCETVVMAVKKVLSNDRVDRNIVHIVEKSCALLPAKYNDRCHTLMEIYGDSVIHLIETYGTKGVCQKIGLCSTSDAAFVRMHREKRN